MSEQRKRYYLRNRPPAIGTYPAGAEVVESFGGRMQTIPGSERTAWGYVEYADRLTLTEIWRYELWPTDSVEAAVYVFWLSADRPACAEDLAWLVNDYLSTDRGVLERFGRRDQKAAAAAMVLLDEGVSEWSPDLFPIGG